MSNTIARKYRTAIINGAFQDGIDDYCVGVPLQCCRYTRRAYRAAWIKGWHHMDHVARVALAEQAARVTQAQAYMGWLTVAV